jgi:transposase
MPVTSKFSSATSANLNLSQVDLPSVLPDDPDELKALLLAQQRAVFALQQAFQHEVAEIQRKADERIQRLIEQIELARRRMFAASSEKSHGQAHLFDEAEVLAQNSSDEQDQAPIPAPSAIPATAPTSKPKRGKRSPLPPQLERFDVVHDIPEAERLCACGTPMVEIGEDISEQLDIVPMQIRVLRNIRKRYGCPNSLHAPQTAALPPQPLPKSNASPDFLAMLLTSKYVDGLPLARFENILQRHGMPVPRQTLARWVIGAARLLQPLHNLIRDQLFEGGVVHMDETTVQVLKEDGKSASSTSYMWVQNGGPPGKSVVIYDYDPSRSGAVPARLLADYRGYLMTDGYEGYNQLARAEGIEHLVCWAHARRHLVEAARVQPKGKRGKADEAIEMIGQLYGIERRHQQANDEERLLARQTQSRPILAVLHGWLEKTQPGVPPQSALGKALAYLRKYWNRLIRYTERGDLPLDNNRCENSIRPFVVGRKGWLFSDTPAGADASAVIYSLVETAKANDVEPYLWLRCIMHRLPAAKTVEDMEALLPWNLHAEDLIIPIKP